MAEQRINIGQVTAPHGIRGEVRVYPLTAFPERWQTLREVFVGAEPQPRRIKFLGWAKGEMPVVQLEGVADREQAEKMRGVYLQVPMSLVHPLPDPDTFYIFQLRGLAVVDPEGLPLGTVADVEESPANDLLLVERPGRPPVRVPMVKAIVTQVDLAGGRVVVRPLAGLFDEEH